MSVRLAPLIIISSVRICAACSDCLRLRSSAIVSPLRLACCTMLAVCCRSYINRGTRDRALVALAKNREFDCTKRYSPVPWGRQGKSTLSIASCPSKARQTQLPVSRLVLRIVSKSAVFDELNLSLRQRYTRSCVKHRWPLPETRSRTSDYRSWTVHVWLRLE